VGNGPHILVDALTPPPLVVPSILMVPPLSMALLPLTILCPFVKLMLIYVIAPLGTTIPLVK